METATEIIRLGLSALLGACVAFGLERYRNRRAARIDLMPFGLRLAALAIRAREEVLNQFVNVSKGPWIPNALVRQKYIFDDLEKLMSNVRPETDELYILLWAARGALDSNMEVLSSWHDHRAVMTSVEHIGADAPSHLDLYSVAYFLTRAVEILPDKVVRRDSQRLAERIAKLRREANESLQPTIKQLQNLDESTRGDWVRTGRKPIG